MSLTNSLLRELPWLRDEALEVCVVGSTALAVACERHELEPIVRNG